MIEGRGMRNDGPAVIKEDFLPFDMGRWGCSHGDASWKEFVNFMRKTIGLFSRG